MNNSHSKNGKMFVPPISFLSVLITSALVVASIGFLFVVAKGIQVGLLRQDKATCLKLESQSREYRGAEYRTPDEGAFYMTASDKSMCDALGIVIEAPVVGVTHETY